jgi:hypothetical protein
VLVDFGLANILAEDEDPHPNLTKSRMTMGTVNYMAPEQRTDAKRVDERADLYALGVIFYELLTGDLPLGRFALPYERGMMLPESVDDCLSKALAREQKDRFQSAEEFERAMVRITAELTQAASQDTVVGGSVLEDLEDDYLSDPGADLAARRDPEELSTTSGKHLRTTQKSWLRRPEVAWAGVALALGAGAGLFVSGGDDAGGSVLDAPGLAIVDSATGTTATYDATASAERWVADGPGWTADRNGLVFEPGRDGARSSMLVTERTLSGPQIAVAATIDVAALSGTNPVEGYAGVAFQDGAQTIGVVRFSGGRCGVLHAAPGSKSHLSPFDCGPIDGPTSLKILCSPGSGRCTASVNGVFEGVYKAEIKGGPWHLALLCADAECVFGGAPTLAPEPSR